jgi:hypothetical protein
MIDMNYVYIGFLLVSTLIVINGTILYFLIKSRVKKSVSIQDVNIELVDSIGTIKESCRK